MFQNEIVGSPLCPRSLAFQVQLLRRNVKRLRGGLVPEAHRLMYHSTLGWRVMKKKRRTSRQSLGQARNGAPKLSAHSPGSLSSKHGTYTTFQARFWHWLSGKKTFKLFLFPLGSKAADTFLAFLYLLGSGPKTVNTKQWPQISTWVCFPPASLPSSRWRAAELCCDPDVGPREFD